MKSNGKILMILEPQSGTSQSTGKQWKKQQFIMETDGQYPRKQAFYVWNDRAVIPQAGTRVEVEFDMEAREFNGNWYTDITAWKITPEQDQPQAEPQPPFPPAPADVTMEGDINQPAETADDLPF